MNQAAARCRWLASRLPLLRFLDSAGVIVNNAPAFRKTLPDQRENSTNITRRARQMPMPEHQGGVVAEKAKLEAGKIEVGHRCRSNLNGVSNLASSIRLVLRAYWSKMGARADLCVQRERG